MAVNKKRITEKEQIWLAEYLKCWNATEAARRADYRHPDKQGQQKKAKFADEIKERIEQIQMSADEVLIRLAEQARGDMGEFSSVSTFEELQKHPLSHLVKRIQVDVTPTPDGKKVKTAKFRLELYDAQSALQLIGKNLGLFKDTMTNINLDLSLLTTEQLERIANGEDVYNVLATPGKG